MNDLTQRSLAALIDGDRLEWQRLVQDLRVDSPELARLQRIARLFELFSGARAALTEPGSDVGFVWGHLRVLELVGEGSNGEVHRAFDPLLEREVALKLRHARAIQARVFIDEARQLARVRHPNVLAVHGAAIHDGRAGLWSDLILGRSLEQWVEQEGPRPIAEIVPVVRALAAALAAVHAADLVHGDVKPGNVMHEDGSGRIVLMDFGSAADRADAEQRGLLGSPASMAPEQWRGDPIGPSADIYGVGVILFYLATGTYPERSDSDSTTGAKPGEPALVFRGVVLPRSLRRVLAELLDPSPDARPEPVVLEHRLQRIVEAPRRRRKRFAVGVVVASLTVGLLLSLYALVRIEAERNEAVIAREQEAAVSAFMADMLTAPNPTNEGADVRVTEVLDVAAREARISFADRPRLLLPVLSMIGKSYRGLGLRESAQLVLTDSLALSRAQSGANSEASLNLEAMLAELAARETPSEASLDTLKKLLARSRTHLGDKHRTTVYLALTLSDVLAGHPDRADDVRELLDFVISVRPPDDPESIAQRVTALYQMGNLELANAHPERAEALYAEAMALNRRRGEDWSINSMATRLGLALVARDRGDLAEAELQFRAILDASERRFGPAHRNLRIILLNLGAVLVEEHKFTEAIPLLTRSVELAERYGHRDDAPFHVARNNLANALAKIGRLDEARVLREEVHAHWLRLAGADHPKSLIAAINLAEQRLLDGDAPAAFALATDAAERAARVFAPEHLFVLEASEVAARAQFLAGDRAAALASMARLCARKAETLDDDSPHTASCNAHYAELLGSDDHQDEAVALLTATIKRNAKRYGAQHPSTEALRERRARLTEAAGTLEP